MTAFVALLRAVNVGGTGKLAMKDLCQLCLDAGFTHVTTYIQSGNVVFLAALSEAAVKTKLEKSVAARVGKPTGVLVRTAAQLEATVERNPFKSAPPTRVVVLFLDEAPAKSALAGVPMPSGEQVELAGRDVFIHYPAGQGTSKLKLPFAHAGTGRNMNTVAKLATMARALEPSVKRAK